MNPSLKFHLLLVSCLACVQPYDFYSWEQSVFFLIHGRSNNPPNQDTRSSDSKTATSSLAKVTISDDFRWVCAVNKQRQVIVRLFPVQSIYKIETMCTSRTQHITQHTPHACGLHRTMSQSLLRSSECQQLELVKIGILKDRSYQKDNLGKRNWNGSKTCCLCNKLVTIYHLLSEHLFNIWSTQT